jgi:hypothetical protein
MTFLCYQFKSLVKTAYLLPITKTLCTRQQNWDLAKTKNKIPLKYVTCLETFFPR